MAENIDVKATLTADDEASPKIKKLLAQIKALERQMKTAFKKPINTNIVDEKVVKWLEKTGGAVGKLTESRMRWARALQREGKLTRTNFEELIGKVRELEGVYKKNENARNKLTKNQQRDLRRLIQEAHAFKAVWNQGHEQYVKLAERRRMKIIEVESAARGQQQKTFDQQMRHNRIINAIRERSLRDEQRAHDAATRAQARRHAAMRGQFRNAGNRFGSASGRMDGSFFNSPFFYGMAAAGGAAAAGRSSFNAAAKVDTANTNLRMFGGLTKDQVAEIAPWANKSALKFGIKTGDVRNILAEVLKAGFDTKDSKSIAELIMQGSSGLDMDVEQTTRMASLVASLRSDLSNLDVPMIERAMRGIAVAAKESPANTPEILSGFKRGAGVLASTKMAPEELAAFAAGGVTGGIQQGRAGNMLGFLTSELVKGGTARGQRGQDIQKGLQNLGMGNKAGFARRFAENPTEMLMGIFDKMGSMNEVKRNETAVLLGMREWSAEIMQMVQVRGVIRKMLEEIRDPKNANFLSEASAQRLDSLDGVWKRVMAAWDIFWSTVGFGLDQVFRDAADFIFKMTENFDGDAIKAHIEALVIGFVDGLGFKSVTEMLEYMFGKPGEARDYIDAFRRFATGFAKGLKAVIGPLLNLGNGGFDAESIGQFVGGLLGLSAALHFGRPAWAILASLKDIILSVAGALVALRSLGLIAGGVAGALGIGMMGGLAITLAGVALVGTALAVAIMNWDAIKTFISQDERVRTLRENKGPNVPIPSAPDTIWKGLKWLFTPTGANASEIPQNMIHRAALRDTMGLLQMASLGSSGGAFVGGSIGSGGGLSGLGGGSSGLGGGGVDSFGLSRGGIIGGRRGGGGGGGNFDGLPPIGGGRLGRGAASESFSRRAPMVMERLQQDFGLTREQAAGVVGNLGHESAGIRAIQEGGQPWGRGGFGWAQWTGPRRRQFFAWAQANGLDPRSDEANYGFLKHELMTSERGAIAAVKRQSTVQGSMIAFERSFERAGVKHYGNRMVYANRAMELARAARSKTGADVAAGVPLPPRRPADLTEGVPTQGGVGGGGRFNGLGSGGGGGAPRGGDSPVNINIHGGSSDPEALAQRVQRRISEETNWRMHDVEYDL